MKRIGTILSLSILIVLLSCSAAFATGLKLVESYPENGTGGLQPAGVAMKLHFNQDVSSADIQEANKRCMKLTDKDGKAIPLKLLHSKAKPKDLLVIVDKTLEQNSAYKFTLTSDFKATNGESLGQDIKINFKTRNVKNDTNVNMLLMGVMVVAMVFFSSRTMKRQLQKEQEQKDESGKVNPYKVAKETGKSVEEVVAKAQKEKEKANKHKKNNEHLHLESKKEKIEEASTNKRVKTARPISDGGSSYVTGRKGSAKEEKSKSTHPKNATGKSRNTKKK